MATTARQQYFADESSLQKDSREFSIANDIQQKIDSVETGAQVNVIETVKVNGTALTPDANKAVDIEVPDVIDNLYTVDSDDALSAKQGKLLYDYIQNLQTIGRFLSNWNSATGLPVTNPSESPYIYKAGDYYRVSNVATSPATNYKPNGSSFVIGQASTTVETNNVNISDLYLYDGTDWILLSNSGSSIAIDSSLSTTSTNPVENRVITNALNGKQETLIAGTNIQIAADGKTISATDTTYTAGTNVQINSGVISATDTTYTAGTNVQISNQNVISATDTKYTAGTGISIDANNVISNTQTSAEWGNITGTLSDQTDLQTVLNAKQDNMVILKYGISTWNDFITAYNKNGVIYCRASSNSNPASGSQTRLAFMAYVNNETTPTEVEFQYYRSRSDHNTAANQLDQVFVYKLTSASGGTWTVTERNTAAKATAGTGISLSYGSGNMTIANDGVTSVNGSTGAITGIATTSDIPTVNNATLTITQNGTSAGTFTANASSNTTIALTDTTYNAGEGIQIGTVESDMKGPCPSGFHVPLSSEWNDVKTIWTTLGGGATDGTNFGIALKLPFAGYRNRSTSDVSTQGSSGSYWSSSRYNDDRAYNLRFDSSSIGALYFIYFTDGNSIRCFKDSPVIPTSSWTKLYGTSIEAGGIFWSATDGLISLSSDGTTWITIADKNLGATTVWNSGDTLSEANCGKYYQWGNNYGFPFTGSVTTSSTQVDASTYGPGNYYSSDIFITRNASPYKWDSSDNGNLWGGVSQGTWISDEGNSIINTGVLSVNGQTGDVTIPAAEESNTKTFYLSSTSDLTNAQAALDWYLAGKNPIIVYNNIAHSITGYASITPTENRYYFRSPQFGVSYSNGQIIPNTSSINLTVTPSTNTVTEIWNYTNPNPGYLSTGTSSGTYTPTQDNHPATKKYVDDTVSGGVQISSQANNILTSGAKLRAGTQSNYEALSTYDTNTVYMTIG